MVLPLKWNNDNYKPMCIHLAGTGDHVRLHQFIYLFIVMQFILVLLEEAEHYGNALVEEGDRCNYTRESILWVKKTQNSDPIQCALCIWYIRNGRMFDSRVLGVVELVWIIRLWTTWGNWNFYGWPRKWQQQIYLWWIFSFHLLKFLMRNF